MAPTMDVLYDLLYVNHVTVTVDDGHIWSSMDHMWYIHRFSGPKAHLPTPSRQLGRLPPKDQGMPRQLTEAK